MGTRSQRICVIRSAIAIAGAVVLQLVLSAGSAAASSGGGTFPMLLAR